MPSNESLAPFSQPFKIPLEGALTDTVSAMVEKEMEADTPPLRDLGRFTTTKFDDATTELISKANIRNQACVEEYPSIARFQQKCVSILASLWNAPLTGYFGIATTGSSEAVLLGGLTMKRQWQMKSPNNPNPRPNVIIGANAHICVNKFADYFDVEARIVPVSDRTGFTVDDKAVRQKLDDNTVGVFLTLGTTYTGHYDPIQSVSDMLDDYERQTGNSIPIHVDAASGGFVAPFSSNNNSFIWDFRLPRVQSINSSGHKYGQAPMAVGWMIWREKERIPQDLLLESSYLRGSHTNFSLSFSRSGGPVAGQYYNFHRLGMRGYREAAQRTRERAQWLCTRLHDTGYFACLSDHSPPYASLGPKDRFPLCHDKGCTDALAIPIVVFTFSDRFRELYPQVRLPAVSDAMHVLKLSIPSYTLGGWGAQGQNIDVMRVVVRDEITTELLEEVFSGLRDAVENLIR
ncbi:hypothetical protein N7452_007941 [Penicillium brevicompactum]|uniref:Glutamate decarboxylase n=1 Tax=Penicillium brevicompactum TaxID=5074 RepID=A0A9W9QGH2_PENBR|nr:hypothetical protein N7452_007941 [Penicillium brevicompactum]